MVVVLPVILLGTSAGRAADYSVKSLQTENDLPSSWLPTLSVVGTLAPNWTDNAFFSHDDRRSDWYLNSDVSLRLDGRLAPDWAYRFYVRSDLDAFSRETDANASMALWGARLSHDIAGWMASAIFENRYDFLGIYETHNFTAYDVKGALSRNFMLNDTLILSPLMQARYRFADQGFAEYARLDLALGIEARLNERWSIVSSPFFEAYWFTQDVNVGRRDQIYSASLGLKYNFTPRVALTTSAAFEERFSNVAIRRYRSVDIGPRLNFSF